MAANVTDSFNFKVKITGQADDSNTKNVELMVPLKYLSNCWRTLEIPLINSEINLILIWSANWVIVSTAVANQGATFVITDAKLCVPVDQLKSGFRRTINQNKYQSKVSIQRQDQYLDYLIDPSFQGVNRNFVL